MSPPLYYFMRHFFLEEAYRDLTVQRLTENRRQPNAPQLLNEAPTVEQEWLSKNIIGHLQKAIDGLNISRSHIPNFITRDDVSSETENIQKVLDRVLEIWQNIQDTNLTVKPQQNVAQPPK